MIGGQDTTLETPPEPVNRFAGKAVWNEFTRRVDASLFRLARGRGAVDLALGDALLALGEGARLLDLGFARRVDYARERLGVSARTSYLWTRLARTLRERPVLRRAVAAGLVTPRKALVIAPVAVGDAEAAWTAAATTTTVSDLEARVRACGAGLPTDSFEVETLVLKMTGEQQDRLDAGIAAARDVLGHDRPRWQCVEAIAMETLGSVAAFCEAADDEEDEVPATEIDGEVGPPGGASVDRLLTALVAAMDGVLDAVEDGDPAGLDARALDRRIHRLLEIRQGFDVPFGRLAELVSFHGLWRRLGFRSFDEYCRERLGLAARTVRERIWLERQMCALPPIREALAAGRLTFAKALLVARHATIADVEARIADVASTTWQQADRESTAEEDRRDRALETRRLWGPKDAAETVALAIAAAQRCFEARGEVVGAGETLARMADHFVVVWSESVLRIRHGVRGDRRAVLLRHGGLCAVPGCSSAAEHEHHVRFRSRGGTEDVWNRVALCDAHHLRGIHEGRLEVSGRAGERLAWRVGGESFEMLGDDNVRRLG